MVARSARSGRRTLVNEHHERLLTNPSLLLVFRFSGVRVQRQHVQQPLLVDRKTLRRTTSDRAWHELGCSKKANTKHTQQDAQRHRHRRCRCQTRQQRTHRSDQGSPHPGTWRPRPGTANGIRP